MHIGYRLIMRSRFVFALQILRKLQRNEGCILYEDLSPYREIMYGSIDSQSDILK
jgi:hypothetical protein